MCTIQGSPPREAVSRRLTERSSQICSNLSVSAAPSHLPWKGRLLGRAAKPKAFPIRGRLLSIKMSRLQQQRREVGLARGEGDRFAVVGQDERSFGRVCGEVGGAEGGGGVMKTTFSTPCAVSACASSAVSVSRAYAASARMVSTPPSRAAV